MPVLIDGTYYNHIQEMPSAGGATNQMPEYINLASDTNNDDLTLNDRRFVITSNLSNKDYFLSFFIQTNLSITPK